MTTSEQSLLRTLTARVSEHGYSCLNPADHAELYRLRTLSSDTPTEVAEQEPDTLLSEQGASEELLEVEEEGD